MKNEQKEKLKSKKNNGITLIALVITIIVLLILAGVTIATLTGDNGILTKATESKNKTEESEEKEKIELSVVGALAKDNGGEIKEEYLDEELANNFGERGRDYTLEGTGPYIVTIEKSKRKYTIDKGGNVDLYVQINGKYYDTETDITVGGKPVTIPEGAQVSGIDGEYESVENGFVIYIPNSEEEKITDWSNIEMIQKTYDQFVWVPVEKNNVILDLSSNFTTLDDDGIKQKVQDEINVGRYPMAIKKDTTNYIGILYGFSEETDTEESKYVKVTPLSDWQPTSTTSGYREPDVLTGSSGTLYDNNTTYLNQINEILSTNYTNAISFKTDLERDFNDMVTRIASKGGFWVGRYETSSMNQDQITVKRGTKDGISYVGWHKMYAKQKKYSSQKTLGTLQSSMIWGSQWDQIMIWMKEVKNTENTINGQYYVTNAVGMGNYGVSGEDDYDDTSNPTETGYYDVKNIFDLAGGVEEWILEACYTNNRVRRRRML